MLGSGGNKGWGRVAMIGMDKELEYLIKAWKRVRINLRNTERVGAGNGERMQRRQHKKTLWEETLRRRLKTQSVGAMDGREPTWKRKKARYASRELPQTVGAVGDSLWMWIYAVQRSATASPILELLFHTG